jgi:hypothetical protein
LVARIGCIRSTLFDHEPVALWSPTRRVDRTNQKTLRMAHFQLKENRLHSTWMNCFAHGRCVCPCLRGECLMRTDGTFCME